MRLRWFSGIAVKNLTMVWIEKASLQMMLGNFVQMIDLSSENRQLWRSNANGKWLKYLSGILFVIVTHYSITLFMRWCGISFSRYSEEIEISHSTPMLIVFLTLYCVAIGNEELLVTVNKCHLKAISFSFSKHSMHLNYFCNNTAHLKLENLLHNCLCLIFNCTNLLALVFHFESLTQHCLWLPAYLHVDASIFFIVQTANP